MALFKIFKGKSNNLPSTYNEGYCYFTTDSGKMYIDTSGAAGGRVVLNAEAADKLTCGNVGNSKTPVYFNGGIPHTCELDFDKYLPLTAGENKKLTGPLGLTNGVNYGSQLPDAPFTGQVFYLLDDGQETPVYYLPTGGSAGQTLVKNSSTDGDASWKNYFLKLSGGTVTGFIKSQITAMSSEDLTKQNFNGRIIGFDNVGQFNGMYAGNGDDNGQNLNTANLIFKSWNGIGFVDGCTGQGMTIGFDCRTGCITAKKHITARGNIVADGSCTINDTLAVAKAITSNREIISANNANGFRIVYGNYGFILRNDGESSWFLLTDSGNPYGSFNSIRPLQIENANGNLKCGTKLYGAVWNDYAEYRAQEEEIKPGYCVISADNGKVQKTNEMYAPCDGIVSDTYGFAIGKTEECATPLAVAGRVLAYCAGGAENFHAGDSVCAGPGGLVYKMTREEIHEWPDRVIGIVSEIPTYETWGTGNVKVDGRIWIKVR